MRFTLAAFLRLNVTESQGMVDIHAAEAGTPPVEAADHASACEVWLIAVSNACSAATILFHSLEESQEPAETVEGMFVT